MTKNIFNREALIAQLQQEKNWDVLIIGGGASGLGAALDSATRGYKTVLFEQIDYAKGTSSRSTKLVHGGVRYLAQGNVDLVREALHERGLLAKNAPHLVSNLSFIIPNYKWWGTPFYTIGLKVYDILSGRLSFGKSFSLSRKKTIQKLKTIKTDGLKGGVLYHDGQFDDSRLAVNIAQTAIEKGATLLNYFKVIKLTKDTNGNTNGVVVLDTETNTEYTVFAKTIINATGVFTDEILKMDDATSKNLVRPSQGIHLVVDRSFLPGNEAIMIPKTTDGRVLFLVPWHNRVILGTTDTLIDSHSLEPKPLEEEIDFILANANEYLNKNVSRKDVLSMYSGLRPLAAPKDKSEKTKEISRSHKVLVSNSKLITITGGKWTTYRRMAQDTINKAIEVGQLAKKECVTEDLQLHGAVANNDIINHLSFYGSDEASILEMVQHDPSLGEKLHPNLEFVKAEVVWAVKNEMARTIEDILARRVRVLFLDAKAAIEIAPLVADIIAKELNKDNAWKQNQIENFTKVAEVYVLKH